MNYSRPSRIPPSAGGGSGGIFTLVEGLRGGAGASTKIELPVPNTKLTSSMNANLHPQQRPPLYVPPSTAPSFSESSSGSKHFIPPISSAIRPPPVSTSAASVAHSVNTGPDPTGRRLSSRDGGRPSMPSMGLREQTPSSQFRRPPSSGTGSGAAFHKGLVNALQDVLRKQRNGVFPGPDGLDEPTAVPNRPSTQSGRPPTSSVEPAPSGTAVDELIRRKKMEWAQKRWQSAQQHERQELERGITSANAFARRSSRQQPISSSSRHDAKFGTSLDDDDDNNFGFELMHAARVLERQEQSERDRLASQFYRSVGDMLANFSTFIRAKQLVSPRSGGNTALPPSLGVDASSYTPLSPQVPHPASSKRPPTATTVSTNGNNSVPCGTSSSGSGPSTSNRLPSAKPPSGAVASARSSSILNSTAAPVEELRVEGNRLYEANDFCGAHRAYSQALEVGGGNPVLLANRAAVHMMLLNYDACARDCLASLQLEPDNAKVSQRLAKAYALSGQHRLAISQYASCIRAAEGDPRAAARNVVANLQAEAQCVSLLERIRRAHELDSAQECLALLTALTAFQGEPPVVLLRAHSLLVVDPTSARQELSKYFATLECPSTYTTSCSSDAILCGNYFNHYCDVLVLLAKASFYCGQHYVTIASSYVKQCLALRPEYRQASQLAKLLSHLEARVEEANEHFQSARFAEAHASLSLALALDTNNKKIRGSLFVTRSEVSIKLGNIAAAISDCTSALECDGTLVKALARRAKCFTEIGDFERAVRDMERAVELNPSLAEDLRNFRAQQQHDTTSYASFQRRFGSAGPSRPGTSDQQRPGTGRPSTLQLTCHYATLQLPKMASVEQVKQQYKRLILQYHPDKVINEPQNVRESCATKFREISNAYSILSDPAAKLQYDNMIR